MPRLTYNNKWNPNTQIKGIVNHARKVLEKNYSLGFQMTLRQLYYQFVKDNILENKQKNYKRLVDYMTKARNAGLIDWDHIIDRGRDAYSLSSWRDPQHFIDSFKSRFHIDWWDGQPIRIEVWVEKDALAQVVQRASNKFDVTYFPNKGYGSVSSFWAAGQRFISLPKEVKDVVIIHLGDHDPSGKDMSRDIEERINMYMTPYRDEHIRPSLYVDRIALNISQVEEKKLPPNPVKLTDSRSPKYSEEFGQDCWELDALDVQDMMKLIEDSIDWWIKDRGSVKLMDDRKKLEKDYQKKIDAIEFSEFNGNELLEEIVLSKLRTGKTTSQLSKAVGVTQNKLTPVLERLLDQKKIKLGVRSNGRSQRKWKKVK